jgi:hypothetical protein
MENLFRILVVVALAVGVYAVAGRPDAPESAGGSDRDPEDVRRIAALEKRVRELESRSVAPAPDAEPDARPVTAEAAVAPSVATAIESAVDRRLDERLPTFREKLVKEYRLDEPKSALEAVVAAKPKTLEEIGEEIGLNGNEIDFIRAEREAQQREILGLFKDEGETDEAFLTRMQAVAEDPEAQAEMQQKIMTKMMSGGGLGKIMAIQGKHDKAIRDRIGPERFRKYQSMRSGLEGGSNLALGFNVMREESPDDGR